VPSGAVSVQTVIDGTQIISPKAPWKNCSACVKGKSSKAGVYTQYVWFSSNTNPVFQTQISVGVYNQSVAPLLTVKCAKPKKFCMIDVNNKQYKLKKAKKVLGVDLIPLCDSAGVCVLYATLACDRSAGWKTCKKAGLKSRVGKPRKWLCKHQYGNKGDATTVPPLSSKYVAVKAIGCAGCGKLKKLQCPDSSSSSSTVAGGGSTTPASGSSAPASSSAAPTTVAG